MLTEDEFDVIKKMLEKQIASNKRSTVRVVMMMLIPEVFKCPEPKYIAILDMAMKYLGENDELWKHCEAIKRWIKK